MNLLGEGNDLVAKNAKDCCAWTTHFSNMSKGVLKNRKTHTLTQCGKTFGGKKLSKEEQKKENPKMKDCCGDQKRGRGKKFDDCDFRYFPQGPAWADMADFARDEDLWLRKYVEAWHIATENGHSTKLKYVSPVVGTCRHKLRRKELQDCSNSKKKKRTEDKENCHYRRWD
jgi:hypothetical protein